MLGRDLPTTGTQPPSLLANMIFGFKPGRDHLSVACSCSLVYTADVSLFLHLQTTVFLTFLCVAHVAREEAKNGGGGGVGGYHASFVAALNKAYPGTKKAGPKTNQNKSVTLLINMKILVCSLN